MTLDETIEVVDYDPQWPEQYRSDSAEIQHALGKNIAAIEHFGSTAVPGMSAKPIVDVLVGLLQWPMRSGDRDALVALGYEHLGESGVAGREYFRRRGAHDTNLAVVEWKGRLWSDNLMLRDYLRDQPDVAHAYSQAKRAAWNGGARTLLAYSVAKGSMMADIVARARAWGAADPRELDRAITRSAATIADREQGEGA